jgi:hypothetical protein
MRHTMGASLQVSKVFTSEQRRVCTALVSRGSRCNSRWSSAPTLSSTAAAAKGAQRCVLAAPCLHLLRLAALSPCLLVALPLARYARSVPPSPSCASPASSSADHSLSLPSPTLSLALSSPTLSPTDPGPIQPKPKTDVALSAWTRPETSGWRGWQLVSRRANTSRLSELTRGGRRELGRGVWRVCRVCLWSTWRLPFWRCSSVSSIACHSASHSSSSSWHASSSSLSASSPTAGKRQRLCAQPCDVSSSWSSSPPSFACAMRILVGGDECRWGSATMAQHESSSAASALAYDACSSATFTHLHRPDHMHRERERGREGEREGEREIGRERERERQSDTDTQT